MLGVADTEAVGSADSGALTAGGGAAADTAGVGTAVGVARAVLGAVTSAADCPGHSVAG
ncbi:MAG: hypothetical protein MUF33_04215 [Candidatus Nanopelagicales bacterium]|nr:hypothetical protein [Candidatus Nanopelagicales bacterium]